MLSGHLKRESRGEIGIFVCVCNDLNQRTIRRAKNLKPALVVALSRHCETSQIFVDSSTEYLPAQVKNLSVAKEMVKSMAVEAQAAREANGLLIMQNGEGTCLEKIK